MCPEKARAAPPCDALHLITTWLTVSFGGATRKTPGPVSMCHINVANATSKLSDRNTANKFHPAVQILLRCNFPCATLAVNVANTTYKLSAHYIGVDAPGCGKR
jgi:hypothetical protein